MKKQTVIIKEFLTVLLGAFCCFAAIGSANGQGALLRGVSAVNEGMAGVATATPVDTIGALNWNPATLSAFEKSDMTFGSPIVLAGTSVESSFNHPLAGKLQGSTRSDTGAVPAPYMGMRINDPESRVSYGFGLFAVGGAQVNYAGSATNPILNSDLGIGRTSAKVEVFQMTPTASIQVTERLSFGFSPTINIGRIIAEPLFFGRTEENAVGGTWAKGAGTRYIWGAGFQVGLYWKGENHFNYGFSYKSPQWFERIPYNISFDDGTSSVAKFELDIPPIYSLGVSYDGFEGTIIGADLRYFDYGSASGFGDVGYKSDGSVVGLGWKSLWAVSVAAEHKVGEKLTVRGGYSYSQSPISGEVAFLNIPCPMVLHHGLHVGCTWMFRPDWFLSVAYAHLFKASVRGEFPAWSRYDSENYVENSAWGDVIAFGINREF